MFGVVLKSKGGVFINLGEISTRSWEIFTRSKGILRKSWLVFSINGHIKRAGKRVGCFSALLDAKIQ
jgi:hypothetical protein